MKSFVLALLLVFCSCSLLSEESNRKGTMSGDHLLASPAAEQNSKIDCGSISGDYEYFGISDATKSGRVPIYYHIPGGHKPDNDSKLKWFRLIFEKNNFFINIYYEGGEVYESFYANLSCVNGGWGLRHTTSGYSDGVSGSRYNEEIFFINSSKELVVKSSVSGVLRGVFSSKKYNYEVTTVFKRKVE